MTFAPRLAPTSFLGNDAECNRVLFLHIPKTAGTSLNNLFRPLFEPTGFHDHLESTPGHLKSLRNTDEPFFASGHLTFAVVEPIVARDDVFSFTVVREPFSQLISHLKWVKYVGRPDNESQRRVLTPAQAHLAMQLGRTPLKNTGEIERLLATPAGINFFDNLQTRYLTRSPDRFIDAEDVLEAQRNVLNLSFACTVDEIEAGTAHLNANFSGRLGNIGRSNPARHEEIIDADNRDLRAFYLQFIKHDLTLYKFIQEYSRANFFRDPDSMTTR